MPRALLPVAMVVALLLVGSVVWLTRDPSPDTPATMRPITPAPVGPVPPPLDPSVIPPTSAPPTDTPAGGGPGQQPAGGGPAGAGPTARKTPPWQAPRTQARTTAQAQAEPTKKSGSNTPARSLSGSATAVCRGGGWVLNVSARATGFTDTNVVVHTALGGGSFAGSNIGSGPTSFNGVAPSPANYDALSEDSIEWSLWAYEVNQHEVRSPRYTTYKPACA